MEVRKVTGIGQVSIPKEYREMLEIKPGDHVSVHVVNDQLIISKLEIKKKTS
jgi:AbrB family looped-hinge helix DNA binding protein